MNQRKSPWIVQSAPRSNASLRLFCLPYAGAGSVIYRGWHSDFPEHVDVCAIEPPGRLVRRREPAIVDATEFGEALATALEPYLDIPFAFFGYSLGALMAFECARVLRRRRKLDPAALIFAAHKAPHMPYRQPSIRHLSKVPFVSELERRYGALEPVIKADPEMLDMIVEIMRRDLSMIEAYKYQAEPAFTCPILALGGKQDASMIGAELDGWGAQTAGTFRAEWLPGAHFFLRSHGSELRALINEELSRATR